MIFVSVNKEYKCSCGCSDVQLVSVASKIVVCSSCGTPLSTDDFTLIDEEEKK